MRIIYNSIVIRGDDTLYSTKRSMWYWVCAPSEPSNTSEYISKDMTTASRLFFFESRDVFKNLLGRLLDCLFFSVRLGES